MEQKTLIISLNDSNRPHVEGYSDYESSIFKLQYDACFTALESILSSNQYVNIDSKEECNNNIIVFDGDRGSGKTSCMLSAANILIDDNKAIFEGKQFLSQQKFVRLPMLEPSFFDKEHNAVTLFVSRLYSEFLNIESYDIDSDIKHELLQSFVQVQQSIKCIFDEFEPKDGLEYLVGLSSAINLRNELFYLVQKFLQYSKKDKSKLLLLIDDIDINPEMAEDMVEQIRKYLVLPNVVVFISMKIDQMSGILHRKYSEEYHMQDTKSIADINSRVEKYITKLFPRMQRVYMPTSESVISCLLEVKDAGIWQYDQPRNLLVRQIVPELIFKKTRYLFYNTNKWPSYIVPRNLRDLRQLLQLLLQMPDYSNEDESIVHYENKRSFKKYLFEEWTEINLDDKQRELVSFLISIERLEEFNYSTVSVLKDFIGSIAGMGKKGDAIGEILDSLNNICNISLGDVLALIRTLESMNPSEDVRKFLFFIRALYSIRLYEAYDTITMSRERSNITKFPTVINRGLHRIVRNDYEAIVAGSVCNVELFDFLPKVTENVRISSREVTKDSIVKLAKKCVDEWDDTGQRSKYVKLMELVMLSVYHDDSLSAETQNNFRRSDLICYKTISSECNRFIFDLGALMFNLTRLGDAIGRFRSLPELKDFFSLYKGQERCKYLIADFYHISELYKVKQYKKVKEKWTSFCAFRNMEILEDFLDYIRGRIFVYVGERPDLDVSRPIDFIYGFFRMASDYRIKSYDRFRNIDDDTLNAYEIHFKFYEKISSLFENDELKNEFSNIFYSEEVVDQKQTIIQD